MPNIPSSKLQSLPQDIPPNTDPQLVVTPDPSAPLKPGKYVFAVMVTDDAGIQSAAATATVEVRNVPVVRLVVDKPVVPVNVPITLNAVIVSAAGNITAYNWSVKSAS